MEVLIRLMYVSNKTLHNVHLEISIIWKRHLSTQTNIFIKMKFPKVPNGLLLIYADACCIHKIYSVYIAITKENVCKIISKSKNLVIKCGPL